MFSGKVVLITGASSGIGAETAREFSKFGANLVLTGRNKENLDMVSKNCEELSPEKLVPLKIIANIKNEKDIEMIIETTIEHFKNLDVLVNNAGIAASGTIETTSLRQFDDIMETNVRGPYYLTMLATPYLIKSKGNIVNVSSVAGLRSFADALAYCTSKAALDQFTRCVALELGPKGVRVNAVNPGDIITGIHLKGCMSEQQYKGFFEECKRTHPLGRIGEPNEVSAVIAFLASDAASNITGSTLPVDGGRQAACPR
ncbi:3-oxoacyl-[acyl-carrier-protein] reductase FabG-like [Maniola hyperantus]|uniref:3-oxoacyl-[acyl-carrier-protein] reductase FabG-like n=1 Tax=Aphantopus hyperantus TaxID=2795564 RepID=UPI00156A0B6C|nr:3-oxoacyl-[acyl-carrier-protein] reductase FabG-like [Maniola hyperantus]